MILITNANTIVGLNESDDRLKKMRERVHARTGRRECLLSFSISSPTFPFGPFFVILPQWFFFFFALRSWHVQGNLGYGVSALK